MYVELLLEVQHSNIISYLCNISLMNLRGFTGGLKQKFFFLFFFFVFYQPLMYSHDESFFELIHLRCIVSK